MVPYQDFLEFFFQLICTKGLTTIPGYGIMEGRRESRQYQVTTINARHARVRSKRDTAAGIQVSAVILGLFTWVVSAHWFNAEFDAMTDGSVLLFVWMFGWMVAYWLSIAAVFQVIETRRQSYAKRLNDRIMKNL